MYSHLIRKLEYKHGEEVLKIYNVNFTFKVVVLENHQINCWFIIMLVKLYIYIYIYFFFKSRILSLSLKIMALLSVKIKT